MRTMDTRLARVRRCATLAAISAVAIFVNPASQILSGNIDEIAAPLSVTIFVFAAVTSLVFIVLWVFFLAVSAYRMTVALLIGLTLALGAWLQTSFMNWNYGLLDGTPIEWSRLWQFGVIDTSVWCAVAGVSYWLLKKRPNDVKFVLLVLLTIQFVGPISATVSLVRTDVESPSIGADSGLDYRRIFGLSAEKNIVVILNDGFKSDVFFELLTEHPEIRQSFEGFEFLPDTSGMFASTYPSIPLVMTGQPYDNQEPISEYIETAYSEVGLPRALGSRGYQVEVVAPDNRMVMVSEEDGTFTSKVELSGETRSSYQESLRIADVALMRSLPHFLKPLIHRNERWFLLNFVTGSRPILEHGWDIDFLEQFEKHSAVVDATPAFKYFYIYTPHMPIRMNEHMERWEAPTTRDNYKQQALGAISLLDRILETYKNLGVYDDTAIVITADHGISMPTNYSLYGLSNDLPSIVPESVRNIAMPVLLVKEFDKRGELVVNDTPTSLADVRNIVTALADGRTLSDALGQSPGGDRKYYYYQWTDEHWVQDYLPPMYEYEITGPVFDPRAWQPTGRIFDAGSVRTLTFEPYLPGDLLTFGLDGNARPYLREGWSVDERSHVWTSGRMSVITLELPDMDLDDFYVLELNAFPYLGGRLDRQQLDVNVNDRPAGGMTIAANGTHRLQIDSSLLEAGQVNRIEFNVSSPTRPVDVGDSADTRSLGVAFRTLQLRPPQLGTTELLTDQFDVSFAIGGNHEALVIDGLSLPEPQFTWTLGDRVRMGLPVTLPARTRLELSFDINQILGSRQVVTVFVNGEMFGDMVVTERAIYSVEGSLPSGDSNNLIVTLEISDARSPQSMGLSNDTRVLGVALSEMSLRVQE